MTPFPIRTVVKFYTNHQPNARNPIFSKTLGKSAFPEGSWFEGNTFDPKAAGEGGRIEIVGKEPRFFPVTMPSAVAPGESLELKGCSPHDTVRTSTGTWSVSDNDGMFRITGVGQDYLAFSHPKARSDSSSKIQWCVRGKDGYDPRPLHDEFWDVEIVRETLRGKMKGAFILRPLVRVEPHEISKLLPGMYEEADECGCLFVRPKNPGRWMLQLTHKYALFKHHYACVVVL